jgi:hypothetical protein
VQSSPIARRTNVAAAGGLLAGALLWVAWLTFSDAAWLHPEVLGSSTYVWIAHGQEALGSMLRKVFDWKAFDPNVNRVRPLNDFFEVIDAIARPYITMAVGPQPSLNVSTVLTFVMVPVFMYRFLRLRLGTVVAALAFTALLVSTIGFLSVTVAYLHPAKKVAFVLLCVALYFAERCRLRLPGQNEALLTAALFASFFADESALAHWAIVGILYWPTLAENRRLLRLFLVMPVAFVIVAGAVLPWLYSTFGVHGAWDAVGDGRKYAVAGYLVSAEFYRDAAIQLARSLLSTIGVGAHTPLTQGLALLALVGLPVGGLVLRRLTARDAARDPLVLATVALIAMSIYVTLLDWFPFPHEVSYLGSFNYYYHSSVTVLVVLWLALLWRTLVAPVIGEPARSAAALGAGLAGVVLNFLLFQPVNSLVQVIHCYPYPCAALIDSVATGVPPVPAEATEAARFRDTLDQLFEGRPNGFTPILHMVEGTPIMTPEHVKNLTVVFYPFRAADD